jgi:hypothetical protein
MFVSIMHYITISFVEVLIKSLAKQIFLGTFCEFRI